MIKDVLAVLGVLFGMYWLIVIGWNMCASDAMQRLTGKKPVDAYWKARRMK